MVSIIIPTLNAGSGFYNLLESLKKQSIPSEVIIVDSTSSDNTVKISESFNSKTVSIKKEDFDHGGTRNLAIHHAQGDILVFLTQDALPADNYTIERLVEPFQEDEKIGAAYGRQLPNPDATFFAAHLRLFNYPDISYVKSLSSGDRGIKIAFLSNSFAAYRRSALQKIEFFKKKLIFGEDMHAGARILLSGYKIAYVADALVYHSHNYTVIEEFKRYFDIGVFHKKESWIMESFGRAEGEGKKFIKSEISFLLMKKQYHLIPEFFVRNGLKYFGFLLGQNYEMFSLNIIKKLSMNKHFWSRQKTVL